MKRTIIACFLLLPVTIYAQRQLSLHDAINIALENSLNVKIAKSSVKIAGINNSYGIAGGLPVITGSGTDIEQLTNINQKYSDATRNTMRNNVVSNNLSGGLNGSVILYNGSRIVTAKKRLDEIQQQTDQQLISRTMLVAANVMLKYYDIIRQERYGKTLQKSIAVSQKKLDIIKAQQGVGMANNADLYQAQVDLNTQTLALQTQQLVIDQDKTDLLTLLTLNPDSTVVIIDTITVDKNIKLDTILNNIDNNPDIIVADQQVQINRYIQREISAQRYPSLNFQGGYNVSRVQYAAGFTLLNQQLGPYMGMGLSVPIFNGTIYKRQEAIAGINANIAQMQRDTLVLGYTANVIKNWQAYTNILRQLETAQQNFELASKLLDLVLQRFQLRQNTILDVENAQQSYENAANLLVNLEYAAKASEIQLKRIANRLDL